MATVAAVQAYSSTHGSWWFRMRMRWGRKSVIVAKAIADYGDLASMVIIFPGLLVLFCCFSLL
jgi:hypothetical protein